MVATCGGVFFGVAPLVALAAGVVWLVVVPGAALRLARLDRRPGIALPVFAYAARLSDCRSSSSAPPPRRRSSSCTARTSRGCAPGPRAASTSAAPAQLREARYAARACARGSRRPGRFAVVRPARSRRAGAAARPRRGPTVPTSLTGQQVHAVVAIPSDGVDTFAAEAARLADDIASISAWWQGQDPTRIPRFDQAAFGAATCADISFVRLREQRRDLRRRPARRARSSVVSSELGPAGSAAVQEVPRLLRRAVGAGERLRDGRRRLRHAAVRTRSSGCEGAPTSRATRSPRTSSCTRSAPLPAGAPHPCPPTGGGSGHPCDRPERHPVPVRLGRPAHARWCSTSNHDDYYAHGCGSVDRHPGLALAAPARSRPGRRSPSRSAAGRARSRATCRESTARRRARRSGTRAPSVRLTAVPAASDRFIRWSGSCTGNSDCVLKLAQAATATAVFGPLRIPVASRSPARGGSGASRRARRTFPAASRSRCVRCPTKGWKFARWSGACKGTRAALPPGDDLFASSRARVFTKKR